MAAAYSAAFEKACAAAVAARRLPPDWQGEPLGLEQDMTGWMRAQPGCVPCAAAQQAVHVPFAKSTTERVALRYHMIATFLAENHESSVTDHIVADVGQSVNRGNVHMCGSLPTLTPRPSCGRSSFKGSSQSCRIRQGWANSASFCFALC